MVVGSNKPGREETLLQKIIKYLTEYGWVALALVMVGFAYKFYNDVHSMSIQQTLQQAIANEKIGILEGKIEILEKMCLK